MVQSVIQNRWDFQYRCCEYFVSELNTSSSKSFEKSTSLPTHRRKHSPTACASCSLYNA